MTWWYTYLSLILFAVSMSFITAAQLLFIHLEAGGRVSWPVVTAALLTVLSGLTQSICSWLVRHGMGAGWPRPWATVLLLAPPVVVWALTLWLPGGAAPGGIPLWIAANILAILLRGLARRLVVVAGLGLLVGHWWAGAQLTGVAIPTEAAAEQLAPLLFFIVFVPVVFLFSAWWWNIVVQLDASRRDAAQLAVAGERLRFASDLHDIQGHHLQVIALKAELAERLLGAGQPEAAGANIHEVRTLARTALEETRSLVRDLREISLEEEIANAKDVLEASGATVRLHCSHVQDPAARTLLGLAVREGATNILRHAPEATEVSIVLAAAGAGSSVGEEGGPRLVMTNDGVEDPELDEPEAGATGATGPASGTGLSGLNRRFAASGGSVAGRLEACTFVLEARVPALSGDDDVKTQDVVREQSA